MRLCVCVVFYTICFVQSKHRVGECVVCVCVFVNDLTYFCSTCTHGKLIYIYTYIDMYTHLLIYDFKTIEEQTKLTQKRDVRSAITTITK